MTIQLDVECYDEHWDEYNDVVVVEIDQDLLDTIRVAQIWLKANKTYWNIASFDYRVDYGVRTEADELIITSEYVYWKAIIKHSTIEIATSHVTLEVLEVDIGS